MRTVLLFTCVLALNHVAAQTIPKNWQYCDPAIDSIAGISLAKAYELLKGRTSKTVVVAVIDNGVDINHQDLRNVIWTNKKEIANNGIDDDRNGYIDDVHGWNFRGMKDGTVVENEPSSGDSIMYGSPVAKLTGNLTHGTHVAGIIKAIADHVVIMPILATTAGGDERDQDVAIAIRYAVDNGAQIINMSFSKLASPDKKLVDDAIRYAEKKDVLIVHAAGNGGVNIDSTSNYHYPIAIYENGKRATNFMTVGWSRELFNYRLAHPRSNYGKRNVDLFAPGSDIVSTVPKNGYASKSGSSMSAPMVSGVAALLRSYFPSLTAVKVREILIRSAFVSEQQVNIPSTQTKVSFSSLSVSGGIVNAFLAVKISIGK